MDEWKAYQALAELMYRNPQKHDGHAYDLDLAAWGLGINPNKPSPSDFGQVESERDQVADFVEGMKEIYDDESLFDVD